MAGREEIAYNLGLQHLLQGRPLQALGFFRLASEVYRDLPRLWIRMAECCIAHCECTVQRAVYCGMARGGCRADRPYLSSIICHLSSAVCCLLSVICCLLSVV